ncbi:MAG: hypothetical protein E6Q34_05225 [Burkholderiaceae bacterium]|nr:MAG: hypothetical protein E6Q34_05225 [Burkholderiaceae bacterium]
MNKITINPTSLRELNASIILASLMWSFMMILSGEIIEQFGRLAFGLLPIVPVALFGLALIRHYKRTNDDKQKTMPTHVGVATALTVVFVTNLSQVQGAGFAQITAMAAYTCFIAALCLSIGAGRLSRLIRG